MRFDLIRIEKSESGTFGVLLLDGAAFCVTLEPEDKDNQVGESCIPEGVYLCKRHISPRFGETFEVTHVPGRSFILIHAGNTEHDTEGCILLGRKFGVLSGSRSDRAILNSGDTFKEFMARTAVGDEHVLTVTSWIGVIGGLKPLTRA